MDNKERASSFREIINLPQINETLIKTNSSFTSIIGFDDNNIFCALKRITSSMKRERNACVSQKTK